MVQREPLEAGFRPNHVECFLPLRSVEVRDRTTELAHHHPHRWEVRKCGQRLVLW